MGVWVWVRVGVGARTGRLAEQLGSRARTLRRARGGPAPHPDGVLVVGAHLVRVRVGVRLRLRDRVRARVRVRG